MEELKAAVDDLVQAVKQLRSLLIRPDAYRTGLLVAKLEAKALVAEALDKWDDASGLRTLATRVGNRVIFDLVDQVVETAFKKYLGDPNDQD